MKESKGREQAYFNKAALWLKKKQNKKKSMNILLIIFFQLPYLVSSTFKKLQFTDFHVNKRVPQIARYVTIKLGNKQYYNFSHGPQSIISQLVNAWGQRLQYYEPW